MLAVPIHTMLSYVSHLRGLRVCSRVDGAVGEAGLVSQMLEHSMLMIVSPCIADVRVSAGLRVHFSGIPLWLYRKKYCL